MSLIPDDGRMKPILILPIGAMDKSDIDKLNKNGICTVEAKDPDAIKFLDPIPATASRTSIEQAAIALSRKILSRDHYDVNGNVSRGTVARLYIDAVIRGTSLDPQPSQQEQERIIFSDAKLCEIQRLAREEAKAERMAAKKVASETKPK